MGLTIPIVSLTMAVKLFALVTLLVSAIGGTARPASGLFAAWLTAVANPRSQLEPTQNTARQSGALQSLWRGTTSTWSIARPTKALCATINRTAMMIDRRWRLRLG